MELLVDLLVEEFILRYPSAAGCLAGILTGPLLIGGGSGGLSAKLEVAEPFLDPAGESLAGGRVLDTCGEFLAELLVRFLAGSAGGFVIL